MNKKVNLFASYKKAQQLKLQKEKEELAKNAGDKPVRMKLTTARRLVVSFLISVMLFSICILLLKNMAVEEETVPVMVTVKDIPANFKMSDKLSGYFTIRQIPVSMLPEGAVSKPEQIAGQFSVCGIGINQMVTKDFFMDKEAAAVVYTDPLEVSVGTGTISQIVGGTIREGDMVNISSVKGCYVTGEDGNSTYTYTAEPIVEKAYVTRTFTAAGERVDSQDTEQPVTVINIIISAEQEEAFNIALAEGTLRISRLCD